MAKKIDISLQDEFKKFINEEKQRVVAKGLFEDRHLFSGMSKMINPNAFVEKNIRLFIGEALNYFEERKCLPTYDIIESLLMLKLKNDIEREEMKMLISFMKSDTSLQELEDFKEIAVKFFKQQEIIKISKKLLKSVEEGYDDNKIREIFDEGKEVMIPTDNELGSSPIDFMEEIFNDEDAEKVPTGYKELDTILGGGLQKGNVGLLAAHTGAGKTTFSTAMAIQAAIRGYKVLQIVFEESEKDITKKQYACLTGDYVTNMSKSRISEATKREVRRWMPTVSDKIIIKRLKNTRTTWEEVENLIYNLRMAKNFNPDVIFVDYFDCLKHTTDVRLTQVQAATRCIKKIDDFAKTNGYAIWVMQQTNRQGAQASTKGDVEGNIQGAFAVQQTTAVNMYLTKSEEEKTANKATLTIKKNRQGDLCTFEGFSFNNGTLQIDMSTATTNTSIEHAIKQMESADNKSPKLTTNELREEYNKTQETPINTDKPQEFIMDKNNPFDNGQDWPDNF